MAVRIEESIAAVLDEAHRRQVEEAVDVFSKRPEGLYKRPPTDPGGYSPSERSGSFSSSANRLARVVPRAFCRNPARCSTPSEIQGYERGPRL